MHFFLKKKKKNAGLFGNHDFKSKYDSVFKNKSYFVQFFLILSHKVKPRN